MSSEFCRLSDVVVTKLVFVEYRLMIIQKKKFLASILVVNQF